MEARIAALEAVTERVEKELSSLSSDMKAAQQKLAVLEAKVEDLPSKDWMTTRLFWVLGSFLVVLSIVQTIIQMTLLAPTS